MSCLLNCFRFRSVVSSPTHTRTRTRATAPAPAPAPAHTHASHAPANTHTHTHTHRHDDGELSFKGRYNKHGDRHGQGVEYLPDGAMLTGEWVDGDFEGCENSYIYPDGECTVPYSVFLVPSSFVLRPSSFVLRPSHPFRLLLVEATDGVLHPKPPPQ